MGMYPEDVDREMGYDAMVDEILEDHKDDIIAEFQGDRLASYYNSHPMIANPAEIFLRQSEPLLGVNNSAALVLAYAAAEYLVKSVFLKPVVCGLIHDENVDELIASIVIKSGNFKNLLFDILAAYDADVRNLILMGSSGRTLVEEFNRLGDVRNKVVHRCEEASEIDAGLAIKLVNTLVFEVRPKLLKRLGIEANIDFP